MIIAITFRNDLQVILSALFFWKYRKVLPPQTGELNVHFGVFFGGLGDFSEAYLNSVDNFRGCMTDVRKICALLFILLLNLSRFRPLHFFIYFIGYF